MVTSRDLHDLRTGKFDTGPEDEARYRQEQLERMDLELAEYGNAWAGVCEGCGTITDPGMRSCPRCIREAQEEDDPRSVR